MKLLFSTFIFLLFISCGKISPKGKIESKDFPVEDFTNINLEGKFRVFYVNGEKSFVNVETYPNILNNLKGCFFCEATAFPHVDYPFESKLIDNKLLWTSYLAKDYEGSIEKFLLNVFDYSKSKHQKHFRNYSEVSQKEYFAIKKILSPIIGDRNHLNTINTLEWLGIQNIEILDGLYKNPRIMIEGPPGSGKTTIAKAFIDKQHNKNGIYLCWNNLLMHYTKSLLSERQLSSNIEVTTYF
ncbi:MAG TPA: ATP-binding protein, partial [Kaistella sp.]|nr:ATP-binding protein [Kaistella sp.]